MERDETNVTEGSTHDDSLIIVLLVVVEDTLHGRHARILLGLVVPVVLLLVPVQDLPSHIR